jgi:hypothetical protein
VTIRVRPAEPDDAAALAPRLRAADVREIQAVAGQDPAIVMAAGAARSDPCHAVVDGDAVIALFGVVPSARVPGEGMVWLLGSNALTARSRSFLRGSRAWLARLHERYRVLWSVVDARNEVHVRWLRWCGFTFLRRIERYGVEGRPFYEVQRTRDEGADTAPGDVLASRASRGPGAA